MKKNYGIGTVSPLLCAIAFIWNYSVPVLNDRSLGEIVLSALRIPTWSGYFDGNTRVNYIILSSLVFLIPALILGLRFRKDWGAKIGMWISGTVIAYVVIMTLAVFIF